MRTASKTDWRVILHVGQVCNWFRVNKELAPTNGTLNIKVVGSQRDWRGSRWCWWYNRRKYSPPYSTVAPQKQCKHEYYHTNRREELRASLFRRKVLWCVGGAFPRWYIERVDIDNLDSGIV